MTFPTGKPIPSYRRSKLVKRTAQLRGVFWKNVTLQVPHDHADKVQASDNLPLLSDIVGVRAPVVATRVARPIADGGCLDGRHLLHRIGNSRRYFALSTLKAPNPISADHPNKCAGDAHASRQIRAQPRRGAAGDMNVRHYAFLLRPLCTAKPREHRF